MFHVKHCINLLKLRIVTSPDCNGYPATSVGLSFGVRSKSGKREIASKKIILLLDNNLLLHAFLFAVLLFYLCNHKDEECREQLLFFSLLRNFLK